MRAAPVAFPVAPITLVLAASAVAVGSAAAQELSGDRLRSLVGTYEYVYEYNTAALVENHYIVLEVEEGELRGWYYGTTDDFDRGREGYLPGFFVAPMDDLSVEGDSITFTLSVLAADCFSEPVPRRFRSAESVPPRTLTPWPQSFSLEPRSYKGAIVRDGITLGDVWGGTRSFAKIAWPEGGAKLLDAPPLYKLNPESFAARNPGSGAGGRHKKPIREDP